MAPKVFYTLLCLIVFAVFIQCGEEEGSRIRKHAQTFGGLCVLAMPLVVVWWIWE